MSETWIDFPGYEGHYQISNFGRVKELERSYYCGHRHNQMNHRPERIMEPHLNQKGYLIISLSKNGKRKSFQVHRMVAIAFLQNPGELPQVNHKDENKQNNFVFINPDGSVDESKSNLEWCTNGYNIRYGSHKTTWGQWMKGRKMSDEAKAKISKANSGKNNGMYGKHYKRPDMVGRPAWNKGKHWNPEVLEKIKKTDHSSAKRPIIMDDNIRFDGIIDAVKYFGCKYSSISRVLYGERKSYKGHTFKYSD